MTPKEKAIKLINEYLSISGDGMAKECALVAVYEILEYEKSQCHDPYQLNYWEQVKEAIKET